MALDAVLGADGQAHHVPPAVDRLPRPGFGPALLAPERLHDVEELEKQILEQAANKTDAEAIGRGTL